MLKACGWSAAAAVLAVAAAAAAVHGGTLDPSFGSGGKVAVDYGGSEWFDSVAVQPDGKIVAGGTSVDAGGSNAGIVLRFNSDGSADASFDGDGRLIAPSVAYTGAVALQQDGKILFAGGVQAFNGMNLAVARYNPDGSPDATFGNGGLVTTDLGGSDMSYVVLAQPDGKVVVVGQAIQGANSNIAVVRYMADGQLDPSFAGDGTLVQDWGGFDVVKAAALTQNGTITVVGYRDTPPEYRNARLALARYTAEGSPDTSFDGDGVLLTDRLLQEHSAGLAVQPDGRLVVAVDDGFAVLRYTPDGRPDTTFSDDGVAAAAVEGQAAAHDLAVQPNGKIVVFGRVFAGAGSLFAVARLLPNGAADPTSPRTADPAATIGGTSWPTDLVLAPDGGVIGVGLALKSNGDQDAVVMRFLPGVCAVPALTGRTLAVARTRIAAANCRVGRVTTVASKRLAKGKVVAQSPAAGRQATDWALVDVVISRGSK